MVGYAMGQSRLRASTAPPKSKSRISAEELRCLIAEISRCRPTRIKPSARLREDLGIDSFTGTEILVALEQRYGFKITEAEVNRVITFQDLVKLIERRQRNRS